MHYFCVYWRTLSTYGPGVANCDTCISSWMSWISPWRAICLFSHQMENGKLSASPFDVTLFITTVVWSHIPMSHLTWSSGGNPFTIFSIWFSPVSSSRPPPFLCSTYQQSPGKRWWYLSQCLDNNVDGLQTVTEIHFIRKFIEIIHHDACCKF